MADSQLNTATTDFDKTVVALVQRRLEEELRAPLVHLADALPAQFIPGTNLMRYIRYEDIGSVPGNVSAPSGAPWLTEGTPPDAVSLNIGYDEFGAHQAGVVIRISDVALTQSPHDLIAVGTDRGLFDAKRLIDRYIAAVIALGANAVWPNGHTSTATIATTDLLTGALVKKAVAKLRAASVPTFGDGYYHCIIHPNVEYEVETDTATTGWLSANTYVDNTPLLSGEIGRFAGVRFMVSAEAAVFAGAGASSQDVNSTVIYGPDAFAFGDMQTMRATFLRGASKSDPLDQKALIGWKAMFGSALLEAAGSRYVRIETS